MSIVKCYHGTSKDRASEIVNSQFHLSSDGDEFLGAGVYFFIEGLCCPKEAGSCWARRFHRKSPSLIEADVDFANSNVLYLNTDDGKRNFNLLKNAFLLNLKKNNVLLSHFPSERDKKQDKYEITNAVIDMAKIDIVVKHEYVNVVGSEEERKILPSLKVENCTMASVINVSKILAKKIVALV